MEANPGEEGSEKQARLGFIDMGMRNSRIPLKRNDCLLEFVSFDAKVSGLKDLP
jgi:hypothetical protein